LGPRSPARASHTVSSRLVRHVGPYDQVRPVFERLAVWAAARTSNIEPLFPGLAHDNPRITPAAQLRFDCCIEVTANVRGENDVAVD